MMNLKNDIKETFIENKRIFLIFAMIFTSAIVISWIFSDAMEPVLMPIIKEALLNDSNSIEFSFIIFHNELAVIITILSSAFFAIMAFVSIFINGFIMGFLGGHTVHDFNSLALFLALIVPHGIFEIPAIFCECVSGFLLFKFIWNFLKSLVNKIPLKESFNLNKKILKQMLILMIVAMVLFAIAAVIETFVTPAFGNWVNIQLTGNALL